MGDDVRIEPPLEEPYQQRFGDEFRNDGQWSDVQFGATFYAQYLIDTHYETDPGTIALPVYGPDGSASRIVRLHAAQTIKIVEWTAERVGAWPTLPHWDTENPNEVPIKPVSIIPANPLLQYNGIRSYRVSGTYKYALKVPLAINTSFSTQFKLPVGASPAEKATSEGSAMPYVFDKSILSAAFQVGQTG